MSSEFLTPVTRTTLTGDISRQMLTHLLRGDWRPGEKIPAERELCLRLGVGRASLREALKALEIMGMIETRLGDGTYVCNRSEFLSRPLLWAIASSSESDAGELVEARRTIEVELAGLAADRATGPQLKQIGVHVDRMAAALGDSDEFLRADLDFHLAVGDSAHNRILMNALHLIRNVLRQWITQALATEGVAATAVEQHRRIFQAIGSKDVAAARSAMKAHLDSMAPYVAKPAEASPAPL